MKPETAGMSSARLARLDDVMKRRYVHSGHLPGMLTYIWRKGQLVHTGMCGQMDIERGKPMREDAIFRIYSMSKPITTTAVMMLFEQGKITLDEPIAKYIPAFEAMKVGVETKGEDGKPKLELTDARKPITIQDLLRHTSGITTGSSET